MKRQLIKLNNAKFGSFGEFVFETSFSTENIVRKHFDQSDFLWNNISCDIKSKRILDKNYSKSSKYYGNRVKGIEYILIEFYKDFVIISKEKEQLKCLGYDRIGEMFLKWYSNKLTQPNTKLKKNLTTFNKLKEKIQKHFNQIGLTARIIYRTTQKKFGDESPDNLIPKKFKSNSVTVFLNFKNFDLNENNFEEVIAFKNLYARYFALIPNPKMHKNKIDIKKIPPKYKFKDIDDLLNNWASR